MKRFTLDQCTGMLPIVKAIAAEMVERRRESQRLIRIRSGLQSALTPEGVRMALAEIEAQVVENIRGINHAGQELKDLGLSVLRQTPLTVHFPGRTRGDDVVFCWNEHEEAVCHGHAVGEEEEPRRPLKVKLVKA